MLTENQLILTAMSQGMPRKQKTRIMKEIEPDPILGEVKELDDPIWKQARKTKKIKPNKTISQWNGTDFLKYIQKGLSNFGLQLETTYSGRDSSWVFKLYDMLVLYFDDKMSNAVLRDYFDWWIGNYARLTKNSIYIRTFMNEYHIQRFVKVANKIKSIPEEVSNVQKSETPVAVSDEDLYNLGGISMLVMSRGLVVAYRVLRKKNDKKAIIQLSKVLMGYSKEVLEQIIETTMSLSYPKEDKLDFISLARPAMKYHGVTRFDNVKYVDFFRSSEN